MDIEESGFEDFVQQVIDGDHLEGASKGIAQKVVSEGLESLSPKQRFVFDRDVMAEYHRENCETCSSPIPWSEVYDAYDNGGNCSYCEYKLGKLDNE
ncbi:hypothetical protein [Pseudomonas sp. NPDC087614]|uniref:hypothetical protein n=1 Tax=Pseudomonas sp. NPDC087614 TaxID=3364442 RepID=UPI00382CBCC5